MLLDGMMLFLRLWSVSIKAIEVFQLFRHHSYHADFFDLQNSLVRLSDRVVLAGLFWRHVDYVKLVVVLGAFDEFQRSQPTTKRR